jgi:ketol-acid reductoisomerase
VVPESAKAEMKKILEEIQAGRFAREFVTETQAGSPSIKAMRKISQRHQIEEVGDKLRGMMPWIQQNRLVDREVN